MITPDVIEEVKNRLIKVYNPQQIYLFGSYAWGMPDEDSDLDLLIVVDESTEKPHKRGKPGLLALWGLCISKDLMIYTKEELETALKNPASFVSKITKKGKLLYVRS